MAGDGERLPRGRWDAGAGPRGARSAEFEDAVEELLLALRPVLEAGVQGTRPADNALRELAHRAREAAHALDTARKARR